MKGTIKYLSDEGRFFGFIRPAGVRDRSGDVFFPGTSLEGIEWDHLFVGQSVDFKLADDDDSRGPRASVVRAV